MANLQRACFVETSGRSRLRFYTNTAAHKARELDENPRAALVLYWVQLDRQVRIEGQVERMSAAESDEYFATRPRESQLGALASSQSEVIESRNVLEQRYAELDEFYRDRSVDRPAHWGGYRLKPERIEFWQNARAACTIAFFMSGSQMEVGPLAASS